jgi:hypothetical protein
MKEKKFIYGIFYALTFFLIIFLESRMEGFTIQTAGILTSFTWHILDRDQRAPFKVNLFSHIDFLTKILLLTIFSQKWTKMKLNILFQYISSIC